LKRLIRFSFIIFVFAFNCKENIITKKNEISIKNEIKYKELNFDSIEETKFNFMESWSQYWELKEFIYELNSGNYSSLIDNKKYLKRFFKGIYNRIPEIIDDSEIKSRIKIIENDFLNYETIFSNNNISETEKRRVIKKINNSFSNLNFQINKFIEKQEITTE
tara:strand:+ start:824 stop:1312 length:489 start_codon:yes stop_codon:yes gene_type:complete